MSFVEVEIDGNILGYVEANDRGRHIADKTVWIAFAYGATTAVLRYVGQRIPQGARRFDR